MFAVIETGGKQYRVSPGDKLRVSKLGASDGAGFTFDQVLLVGGEGKVKLGMPYLKGVKVEAKVLRSGRARKVTIFKYEAKKRYRKKGGHRQPFTQVEINKISGV